MPRPFGRIFVAMLFLLATTLARGADTPAEPARFDVVVYGGTSGGVIAAVQAAAMGKSVCLIHPGKHLGGLTSGGLGATDIGDKDAIGGLSREFYRRLGKHYGQEEAWKFEPHVAEQIYNDWVADAKVAVFKGERLDLKNGVKKDGGRIVSITMESGKTFAGKVFIDTSYEGDLMAKAGVAYTFGREANSQYDETLDGVQPKQGGHNFRVPIDPYLKPGDPASGLLPNIHAGGPGEIGQGDKRVQAYNFRLCLTDQKENQLPFPKPPGYDPARYELLLRYLQAGVFDCLGSSQAMPNHKTDTNNNGAISSEDIGMNYDYPDGDYATREKIFQEHVNWQQGLMWFLANDSRVPPNVHDFVNRWGLCKDEFQDTGGWGHELYVREARRMISDYVMTQHNVQAKVIASQPIGLAAYGMDSHHTQRYVDATGHVRNEGDVEVHDFAPYPIDFKCFVPKEAECGNLVVPVCLSATHIAYGSIRMEPVFMVLGQSAATAACLSIDENVSVQRVDYEKLKDRLLADKQILAWTGKRPTAKSAAAIEPEKLTGIVLDDSQAQLKGEWTRSTSQGPFVGQGYIHDGNDEKGAKSAKFTTTIKTAGSYEIRLAYTALANRATEVPVTISGFKEGSPRTVKVNEREAPPIDHLWISLGTFEFEAGATASVEISNEGTEGYVIVDAVQWLAR